MTTEIKDGDLAIFIRHPNGIAYGFKSLSFNLNDYALYKKSNSGWSQSASVTVQKVIMATEWFSPENDHAVAIRARFADEIAYRLDRVTGVTQEEKPALKISRIDVIGQNGNNGEHYALDRDQVVAAISGKLNTTGKAGLPYVLDAMQSAGLTIAVAQAVEC